MIIMENGSIFDDPNFDEMFQNAIYNSRGMLSMIDIDLTLMIGMMHSQHTTKEARCMRRHLWQNNGR